MKSLLTKFPIVALVLIALAVGSSRAFAQATQPAPNPAEALTREQEGAMLDSAWELEGHAEQTKSADDFRAAADALKKCLDLMPDEIIVRRTLGWIYLEKLDEPKEAYPYLNSAYIKDPTDTGWGLMLAKAAGAIGMTDRQLQVLHEVIARDPNDAETYVELGKALDKQGRTADAEKAYEDADRRAVDEDWVLLAHAHFLHDHGHDAEAMKIANAVIARDPNSVDALGLLGDIHRANWDLSDAQQEYAKAMEFDPSFSSAKTGLSDIESNRAPQFSSDYYLFDGSDHFHQMGLFNTLTVPVSDHFAIDASYNNNYFTNDSTIYSGVLRYQEDLGLEDRVNSQWSFRGGISAFQQPMREVTGFNVGATWKPTDSFWVDATYRLNDPVNDTMYTVANALSQDIVGLSGGYQFTDRLGVKAIYSWANYSDDNNRQFLHAEPFYTLYWPAQIRVGFAYETTIYSESTAYSQPQAFQTLGPVLHAEPPITSWLTLQVNVYPLWVIDPSNFGLELTIGPAFHLAKDLQIAAGYTYYYLPGSTVPYSGNGFTASLTFRF
jgi:tetratricopeptide (TPR) repeat protein